MPPGVSAERLYGWLIGELGEAAAKAWWRWLLETYPAWAREGWTRLDTARADCPAQP